MLLDAQSELNLKNKAYIKALETFVWGNYKLDLPKKDLTTQYFLNGENQKIIAQVISNQKGILGGIQEADWLLKKLKIQILEAKKDGEKIKKNDIILKIKGDTSNILAVERTLLNLIQRMSGIATKTKSLCSKLPPTIKLLATRKTLWGPLDKRAVALGGGGTHRLNLSDAILVKENHIALRKNFFQGLESVFKHSSQARFIEIELESIEEINSFIKIYDELKRKFNFKKEQIVVMLDNFKPVKIKKVIEQLKKRRFLIEVSGGINEKNIVSYNIKGVDAISSSAITMSAPHLDLSLSLKYE